MNDGFAGLKAPRNAQATYIKQKEAAHRGNLKITNLSIQGFRTASIGSCCSSPEPG
jgi:hypothetical protein